MDLHSTSDEILQRYLLDQVPEEDRIAIEQQLLADEVGFQRLLVIEDELRCNYAAGTLTTDQRRRFEERFLIFAEEQQNVALARSMIEAISKRPGVRGTQSGWSRVALAAAALLVMALTWQLWEVRRLRQQLQSERAGAELTAQQTQAAGARTKELERELEAERKMRTTMEQELARGRGSSPTAVFSLLLIPGRVRSSGETQALTLPREAATARLMLSVEGQQAYKTYRVEIIDSEGRRIWSRDAVPGGERVVTVAVPASLLKEDDYELILRGVTSAGTAELAGHYPFRVLR